MYTKSKLMNDLKVTTSFLKHQFSALSIVISEKIQTLQKLKASICKILEQDGQGNFDLQELLAQKEALLKEIQNKLKMQKELIDIYKYLSKVEMENAKKDRRDRKYRIEKPKIINDINTLLFDIKQLNRLISHYERREEYEKCAVLHKQLTKLKAQSGLIL